MMCNETVEACSQAMSRHVQVGLTKIHEKTTATRSPVEIEPGTSKI
jgi:hypothetical protein